MYVCLSSSQKKKKKTFNLNIIEKDNIVYILLVNTTMFLNSISDPNVIYL